MENKIIYHKQIDSTNTELSRMALRGASHGTVVLADAQTAGKGRRGRRWESPVGENIYMSLLLRPEMQPEKAPMLTLVMAYCVAKVLKKQGFEKVQIKWPNDLVLSGKKVCGILTEMSLDGNQIQHVIVGVGINVNNQAFPEEIKGMATSLRMERGRFIDRKEIVENILVEFWKEYERFVEVGNLSQIWEIYNDMLVNCGKEVCVLEPESAYEAVALGINQEGQLRVRLENGEEKEIFAGEVSVRGIYGYV